MTDFEASPAHDGSDDSDPDVLSKLHRRYLLLSGRFKSSWTFHQFLKGVNKVFAEEALELGMVSFQGIYGELKVASKNLNVASADTANEHLDRAEAELQRRLETLLEVDERVTPTLLRRFFKRVRNYDARILGQLLKFYLFTRSTRWNEDRLDKSDYLLTRLGELLLERDLDPLDRQPHALKDALAGIWQVVGVEPPPEEEITAAVDELRGLRSSMEEIHTLESFHQMGVIRSYREFKKSLESLFFHPAIALPIVETNLYLTEKVDTLYQQEERRVAVEYNKVFDLERDVPALEDTLDRELRNFRSQVENLEASARGQNVKINQFVEVSESARELIPRLEGAGQARRRSRPDLLEDEAASSEDAQETRSTADSAAAEEPVSDSEDETGPEPEAESAEERDEVDVDGDSREDLPEPPSPAPEPSLPPTGPSDTAAVGPDPRLGPLPDFFGAPLGGASPAPPAPAVAAAADDDGDGDGEVLREQDRIDWKEGLPAERPMETLRIRTAYAEQLGDVLRQVLQVLETTDWQQSPRLVVQVPEVRGLRLEPREVLAYRRLFLPERFDRQLEQFLVEAAALRVLMGHQAEELADHIDGSLLAEELAERRREALRTVALASELEKRCQHFVQEAVYSRDSAEAAALQVIWMRMLREYSGLWLLLHR